jgi:transcriptional regulator with XRE-family HTH domain
METVGRRVRQARRAKGFTQQDLERVSGVHYTTISRIETGDLPRPRTETLRALAHALEVTLEDLLGLPPD